MNGQYLRLLIRKALAEFKLPASDNAVELLLMIAAHESSGFRYIKQIRGPALGIYQMEPRTFRDLCFYIKDKQERFLLLQHNLNLERLIFDTKFATALARVFFLRISEHIPEYKDQAALARYAKKYWNTRFGKASNADYLTAYQLYGDLNAITSIHA